MELFVQAGKSLTLENSPGRVGAAHREKCKVQKYEPEAYYSHCVTSVNSYILVMNLK